MFSLGTKVRIKNNTEKVGIIEDIKEVSGNIVYKVRFTDRVTHYSETSLMEYKEKPSVKLNLLSNYFGDFNDFQKALTHLKLTNSNTIQNNIYSINTSRTLFLEYQFKPLMKFISSAKRRILICDEVGLGKTIEAGLIINELEVRKELNNALIVVPANLRRKWQDELLYRFKKDFNIIGAKDFRGIIEEDKTYYNKYKYNRFIVSLESIRSDKLTAAIDESDFQWDLLIVDEAHNLRNMSKQHNSIKKLSINCQAIVFLTATPIHTERRNLFNILNILDEQQFEYIDSFETQLKKNEPVVSALNHISKIPPQIDESITLLRKIQNDFKDNEIYNEVINNLLNFNQIKPNNQNDVLEKVVELQMSLSDLHFLGNLYTRTRKRDVNVDRPERKVQTISIDLSDIEKELYKGLIDTVKETTPRSSIEGLFRLFSMQRMLSSSLHAHYKKLYEKYNQKNIIQDYLEEVDNGDNIDFNEGYPNLPDNKLEQLLSLLSNITLQTDKVIIFAFYIQTIIYLYNRLTQNGYNVFIIYGSLKIDRFQIIKEFMDYNGFSVLLSSRIGSEGIDLQFCNTLINYDLPWNPMEIEQRIGRIDRIGQKSNILNIYNFYMNDTIDDEIVMRLYKRIALFESSIGTLEPIMGEVIDRITKNVFFSNLTDDEKRKKYFEEEKVLIQKMKDIKMLEDKSSEILSLDYFYEHEIKNIKGKNRYISPQQLYRYISGYICTKYPDSVVKYDTNTNIGELLLSDDFLRDVRFENIDLELPAVYRLKKPIRYTMDSNIAFENSDMTFINIMHPLVRYITKKYAENEDNIVNTHNFYIDINDLSSKQINLDNGFYFYFIYLGIIKGLKSNCYIEAVILDESLKPIGGREITEQVLSILIEYGKHTIQGFECKDPNYINNAYEIANHIFQERFMLLFNKHKARNDLLLKRKLESQQYNYYNKLNSYQNEIIKIQTSYNQDDVKKKFRVEMLQGKIRKLQNNYDSIKQRLEAEKEIEFEFQDPVIGGVFEIIS